MHTCTARPPRPRARCGACSAALAATCELNYKETLFPVTYTTPGSSLVFFRWLLIVTITPTKHNPKNMCYDCVVRTHSRARCTPPTSPSNCLDGTGSRHFDFSYGPPSVAIDDNQLVTPCPYCGIAMGRQPRHHRRSKGSHSVSLAAAWPLPYPRRGPCPPQGQARCGGDCHRSQRRRQQHCRCHGHASEEAWSDSENYLPMCLR